MDESPGANASQVQSETVETVEIVEERPQRYELEPESEAVSPPADEEKVEAKTPPEDGKNAVHERINKLTENWRTAERTSNDLIQENEELRRRLQDTGPGPEPAPDDIPPRKSLADFDYDDAKYSAYMDDRTDKIIEKRTSEALQGQQRQAAQTARANEHKARENDFASSTDDYWQTVTQVPVTQQSLEVIESSDVGPEVLYYLGKNPQVAQGLIQVPPLEMARRMAFIETEITAAKEAVSQKKVSDAPPPAKKVKATDPGIRVGASDPDSDKLSDAEWLKRRNKEVAAHLKR